MNSDKGSESEDRFFRLLSDASKLPRWIIGAFPASKQTDKEEGIDFYVILAGDKTVEVDVKSSPLGRKQSIRMRRRRGDTRNICFIIMKEELSDDDMRARIIQVLGRWK